MIPEQDILNHTKQEILAQIDVLMGGRAAEELVFGLDEITTGCASDLNRATELAYAFVKRLGMHEPSLIAAGQAAKLPMSDQYNFMCDQEVQRLLQDSYARVKALLKSNDARLGLIAKELIAKETLSGKGLGQLAEEIRRIIARKEG